MWSSGLGRLVLQCINGVSSNPVEGRTKIWQFKDLILTLFGLIFRTLSRKEYLEIDITHVSKRVYSVWSKLLPHVKKSLYNQPKPYFFKKLLWVEGRTKIWQFKDLILTLFGLIFRHILYCNVFSIDKTTIKERKNEEHQFFVYTKKDKGK
jgi:hypothetical protein